MSKPLHRLEPPPPPSSHHPSASSRLDLERDTEAINHLTLTSQAAWRIIARLRYTTIRWRKDEPLEETPFESPSNQICDFVREVTEVPIDDDSESVITTKLEQFMTCYPNLEDSVSLNHLDQPHWFMEEGRKMKWIVWPRYDYFVEDVAELKALTSSGHNLAVIESIVGEFAQGEVNQPTTKPETTLDSLANVILTSHAASPPDWLPKNIDTAALIGIRCLGISFDWSSASWSAFIPKCGGFLTEMSLALDNGTSSIELDWSAVFHVLDLLDSVSRHSPSLECLELNGFVQAGTFASAFKASTALLKGRLRSLTLNHHHELTTPEQLTLTAHVANLCAPNAFLVMDGRLSDKALRFFHEHSRTDEDYEYFQQFDYTPFEDDPDLISRAAVLPNGRFPAADLKETSEALRRVKVYRDLEWKILQDRRQLAEILGQSRKDREFLVRAGVEVGPIDAEDVSRSEVLAMER
ncbi:hypothetical protein BD324DRAFT_652179 [Kockovaella imperatae]|uniref:Uncharacterized protein n=1 Tax=Kockovaella imperatae TaxID=4999 RepID=A0A1Y1UC61_9TREE|nr:hypothetical protein BD324DRAFT_652179 [Kockovaella imperatae]ORX35630.1 hypothetical protein BD324DRAFT_652179 [Kockovaella imperatae]